MFAHGRRVVGPAPDPEPSASGARLFSGGGAGKPATVAGRADHRALRHPVTVVGAAGQLTTLNNAVEGVGPGTSLVDTVVAARTYLAAEDAHHACTTLQAFIKQARALPGKKIPRVTAQALTADATRIRAVLGC